MEPESTGVFEAILFEQEDGTEDEEDAKEIDEDARPQAVVLAC